MMNTSEAPLQCDPVRQPSLSAVQKAPTPQKTILLAEDDDDLRLVMEWSLSSMGYIVVACANAHLASTAFRAHAIDILVTDFEMPGKSGLELARELTRLRPALPVLVITGAILSVEVLHEFHVRHWVYMSKPSLLSVVESTLQSMVPLDQSLAA